MISVEIHKNTVRKEVSIGNIILLISLLTIPMLILTLHFLSVFFNLSEIYEYYKVGATYFFHINIHDNYEIIMFFVNLFLIFNLITVFLIIGFRMKKKHLIKSRKIKIDGYQLTIIFLLMSLALLFLLYHNIFQMNRLTKAIQIIKDSESIVNIFYLGVQLPTNVALIDSFLFPAIIIIVIIIVLVFIKK